MSSTSAQWLAAPLALAFPRLCARFFGTPLGSRAGPDERIRCTTVHRL